MAPAENGVQVGAVAVEQGALRVHHLRDLQDVLVEEAERVRERHHEAATSSSSAAASAQIGVAVGVRGDGLALEAARADIVAGFVPWAESGSEHLVTRLAAALEIGADGQDAVSSPWAPAAGGG